MLGKYQTIEVSFSDGIKGEINQDKDGNFFIKKGSLLPTYIVYQDKVSCLNGLHYYMKFRKVLRENVKEYFN